MSDELKPCPFCGSPPTFALSDVDEYGQTWDRLSCPSCFVYVERALEKDGSGSDVVRRWNARATGDALRGQLAEAVRLLRGARKWLDRVHVEQREEIDAFLDRVKGV